MERQRFAKPYLGRFWVYRFFVGGTWRKYGYFIALPSEMDGWYWTQQNLDYGCGGQLKKLKEVTYKKVEICKLLLS